MCGLRACANIGAVKIGQWLHDDIVKRGMEGDVFMGNTLVHMLGKCGFLEEAILVFGATSSRRSFKKYHDHGLCPARL